jgi:hypothetical protein
MIRQVETWMYLLHTLGDLNIDIIHKKSIPSIAKLISTVPDSNVKICRLCEKKNPDIFVPVCCNCQYTFEIFGGT